MPSTVTIVYLDICFTACKIQSQWLFFSLPLCEAKHMNRMEFCVWEIRHALDQLEMFHWVCSDLLRQPSQNTKHYFFSGPGWIQWQSTMASHLFSPISLLDLTRCLTVGYYQYIEELFGELRISDSFISIHKYLCSRYNHIIIVLYILTHKIHEATYFINSAMPSLLGSKIY